MNRALALSITTGSHILLAAILCFIPLFDLLGYEFSFAITIWTAISGVVLGITTPTQQRSLLSSFFQTALYSILQLAPGLLLICLNSFRVRNCDFQAGFEFFTLLTIPTALYATTLGFAASCLFPKSHPLQKMGIASGLLLLPLALSLWNLYWHPPIFVWDHLWGYFSGSLYDEGIQVDSRLILFRLVTLSRVIVILVSLSLWQARTRTVLKRWILPLFLILSLGAIEQSFGPRWGFEIKRSDIVQELSHRVEVPGLVIHFPPSLHQEKIDLLVEDHQFNLDYLLQKLEIPREEILTNPIQSFVYLDPNHKSRWMGGKQTMVAKPWLNEIQIHGTSFPHKILPHELVHALAAQFGSSLLGVSANYEVAVNLTLVEGLAEALTPPTADVDLDHYSKAMRALKLAPNLRNLLSPTGFWKQSPRRAYTIAGSFVNFLLKKYGVQKFKLLYPSGDFDSAYNQSLESLVTEWESRIDALPLPDKYKRDAQEKFKRPSIFERPCAHVISALQQESRRATPCRAIEVQKEIVEHLGQSPSARVGLAQALLKANKSDDFWTLSRELLSQNQLPPHLRVLLLELEGNEYWKADQRKKATKAFAQVLQAKLDPNSKRLQWVRLWALEQSKEVSQFIRDFLSRKIPVPAGIIHLKEFAERAPEDSTFPYLLARQLHAARAFEDAIAFLHPSLTHPCSEIAAESLRLIGDSYWNLGKFDQATEYYQRYQDSAPTTGEAARAQVWLERIQWKSKRTVE